MKKVELNGQQQQHYAAFPIRTRRPSRPDAMARNGKQGEEAGRPSGFKKRWWNRLIRSIIGLTVVLAGLVAISGAVVGMSADDAGRHLDQETLLYFELAPDFPTVGLELAAGTTVVRLESILVLDTETHYDPRTLHPYGLELELLDDDGHTLETRVIHQETRLSRAGWEGEGWTWANASVRDGSVELADNRLTEIPVMGDALPRRVLKVRALKGQNSHVLLRAYARRDIPAWEQALKLKGIGPRQASELAERITHRSWSQLGRVEREALVSHEWMRLAAVGNEGTGYRVKPVWFSGFALPDAPRAALARFYATPWRDMAINARGPGTLILERDDLLEEVPPQWPVEIPYVQQVFVRLVGESDGEIEQSCVFPRNSSRCEIPITAQGLVTLHISTRRPLPTRERPRAQVLRPKLVLAETLMPEPISAPETELNLAEKGEEREEFQGDINGFSRIPSALTQTVAEEPTLLSRLLAGTLLAEPLPATQGTVEESSAEGSAATPGWIGLRVYESAPEMAVGDRPVLPEAPGLLRVQPDVRTLYTYRIDAALTPLRLGLFHPKGDIIGLILRPELGPPPAPEAVDMSVELTLTNAEGVAVGWATCAARVQASRYEFYRDSTSNHSRVGERTACYVPYPAGARWLEVRSQTPVDVQFLERAPWVTHEELEPPYRLEVEDGVDFRYAPLFRRKWEPVRPTEEAALWQADRMTRIAAQVRLEVSPVRAARWVAQGPAQRVEPEGEPLEHLLLEPIQPAEISAETTSWVALVPGEVTAVSLPGGPVRVHHRVGASAVGSSLALYLDATSTGKGHLQTRIGTLSLARQPQGTYPLRLEAPPGLYLVEGSSPSPAAQLYRRGTVYPLRRGEPLVVTMPSGGNARFMHAQIFVPSSHAGPLQISSQVDTVGPFRGKSGGTQLGPRQMHTVSHSMRPSEPSGSSFIQDLSDVTLHGPHRLTRRVVSGGVPGIQQVSWRIEQGPEEVYVRFIVRGERQDTGDSQRLSLAYEY